MGIIGDLIRGAKSTASKVKGIFTQQPTTVTPQKTLNEEIDSQEQTPTTQVGSFPNMQNTGSILNVPNQANTGAGSLVGNQLNIGSTPQGSADKGFKMPDFIGLGEDLIDWGVNAYTRQTAKNRYNRESIDNTREMVVDYDKRTNKVTTIIPRDEDAFYASLEAFDSAYNSATTPAEQQKAWEDFYEDVRGDFRTWQDMNVKHADNLWDKIFNQEQKYSDETLAPISGRGIKQGDYPISQDELSAYLDMLGENYEMNRNIYEKYKDDLTAGLDTVDIEESESSNEVKERFVDIAKKDTLDLIKNNVALAKRGEATANIDEIVNDPIDRLLTSDMYLKRLRDEAAETPERFRTDWQNNMIYAYDVIWKRLMDQYASNVNDYLMLQLTEGVDDKGEISDALWRFEDGSQLNDILRNGLAEIAGIEISGWTGETLGKVSALDIMRRYANEAAYEYRKEKLKQGDEFWDPVKSVWNKFEHWQEPAGEAFSEAGQSVWRLGTKIVNTPSYLRGGSGWNSPASAFWDADFSVGKLIETDDSPNRRTVKKYGLQFGEYIPEGLGAIFPDMALTVLTSGGSAPLMLRWAGWVPRLLKRFNGVNNYLKKSKALARTLDTALTGLEKVEALGREWGNINSSTKRIWNIVDRTLSQFAVGQSMDAKLSAFDTEPYSDTSFWLSMGGSLLGDILPEAKDIWGVMRTGAREGKAWTKGTGVRDLVDFISQSDENAMLVAKQMGKDTANFSEQDLKNYVRAYANVTDAAKQVFENLTPAQKAAANEWTKELMYNYVKQAYYGDTRIGRAVREIVKNKATNPADIIKYIGGIPGTVSIGPYQSTIRLKQGTLAGVQTKDRGWYNVALDSIDGGFGHKVPRGFTFKDLQDISQIEGYEDVLKNRDKYFRKVTEKVKKGGKDGKQTRWILSEDGLDKFGLETKNLTLASLGIEISGAENVKEIFKEKMKGLNGMNLSENTIDALAENGGYSEVVSKIENILC